MAHTVSLAGTLNSHHRSNLVVATTGNTGTSTNYGPHDSNLANKADPRVDSDMGKLDRRLPSTQPTVLTACRQPWNSWRYD
jgi:hypothetical protein